MTAIRQRLASEDGVALVLVVFLSIIVIVLASTLIGITQLESAHSAAGTKRDASFQAAEAGIDDYLAKLVDDPSYYTHLVHPAESTRRDAATGSTVGVASTTCDASGGATNKPAPVDWTFGLSWTYPTKDHWCQLGNGYEYNLQVTPLTPTVPGGPTLSIVSTGRPVGTMQNTRVVEAQVRRASVADYQMMSESDIWYGAGATSYGKVYAGKDPATGNAADVRHDGDAYADVYAEGRVYGTVQFHGAATAYDNDSTTSYASVRGPIPTPISFNSFLISLTDVKRAAQVVSSTSFPYLGTSSNVWWLKFQSDGTVKVQGCSGSSPSTTKPTSCGAVSTYSVPAKGAIYSENPVIVEGTIDGRVTVASFKDIIVSGDITYEKPGDDVLGLIAQNNIYVARWVNLGADGKLTWYSAALAETGVWRSTDCPSPSPSADGPLAELDYYGSTATKQTPCMNMFVNRIYNYDPNLLFLPPPWFPTIGGAFTIVVFRELPSS
jgi:hypothetical protein